MSILLLILLGRFVYDAVFGRLSLKAGGAAEALGKDAVCWIASCELIVFC